MPIFLNEMTLNNIWPVTWIAVSMVKFCYCEKTFQCTATPSTGYSIEPQDKHLCLYQIKWLNTEV